VDRKSCSIISSGVKQFRRAVSKTVDFGPPPPTDNVQTAREGRGAIRVIGSEGDVRDGKKMNEF